MDTRGHPRTPTEKWRTLKDTRGHLRKPADKWRTLTDNVRTSVRLVSIHGMLMADIRRKNPRSSGGRPCGFVPGSVRQAHQGGFIAFQSVQKSSFICIDGQKRRQINEGHAMVYAISAAQPIKAILNLVSLSSDALCNFMIIHWKFCFQLAVVNLRKNRCVLRTLSDVASVC